MKPITPSTLLEDLSDLLSGVSGSWSEISDAARAESVGSALGNFGLLPDGTALAVMERKGHPTRALHGVSVHGFSLRDQQFLRKLVAVFNADIESTGDFRHHRETWTSLSATRYVRAVARVSAFSTSPLIGWLATFEAATRQTYEGDRFSGSVLFTKQLKTVTAAAGPDFIPVPGGLAYETALLSEKWVKPLLAGGQNALVAVGHNARVAGLVDCGTVHTQPATVAPHERLEGLFQFLAPGTATLVASKSGDIYMSLPNGMTFTMSQGRWRYEDHDGLVGALDNLLDPLVSQAVVRLALNARFDRSGALFVFLEREHDVDLAVPDHYLPSRVSGVLRKMVADHSILDAPSRRMISSVAAADGAMVLSRAGRVLDGACMITDPSSEVLAARGISARQRFAGARTTAAWNASVYGCSVKVSEDGPIEVYSGGSLVFRVG